MSPDRYREVKERIRITENKERRWDENKRLWDEVEVDCSPQQKTALYALARQLNEDADYADMYYSQF